MKKVLFVATVASHIKGFHEPYLKLFKEQEYKTYVAAKWNIENETKLDYTDQFIGLPIQRNPLNLNNIKAIKELKKICNEEKFDIIHCHTPMGGVAARLAAKHARKKYHTRVIYTAHGFHFFKGAPKKNWILYYPIEWYLAKYTDTLITINKEDYELAKTKFSKRCHDIKYVPGVGIDTKKFDIKMTVKEKNDLRKSIGLKKDDFVLTCVARLDKNKNQGFLIKCMKELVKDHSDIHLILAGGDELNGYYQNMVKEYNLEDYVHFLGHRSDIPQILKISNVVVSASKREGLGLNLIEAIASNVPVIAVHNRGHNEIVVNGKNGYLINQDDSKEFIKKINIVIKNNKSKDIRNTIKKFDIKNPLYITNKIYFKQ